MKLDTINMNILIGNNNPIGMIDSGLGGLSLFRYIRSYLPNEDIIYIADSKNVPYGDKESLWILNRSIELVKFLVEEKKCKIIVIACNTITAVAIDHMRSMFEVPIIAIEPAIKSAIRLSKKKKIAVLATLTTVNGKNVSNLIKKYAYNSEVILIPCIGLADKIENGILNSVEIMEYIEEIFKNISIKDIDIIVLGCTHYPFVKNIIQFVVGNEIKIIEPSIAVTNHLINQMNLFSLCSNNNESGYEKILTSSDKHAVEKIVLTLLNKKLSIESFQ